MDGWVKEAAVHEHTYCAFVDLNQAKVGNVIGEMWPTET